MTAAGTRHVAVARIAGLLAATPALLAAAPFWIVGGLTRKLSRVLPLGPRWVSWPELLHYVPELGVHSKPDLDTYAPAEGLFHLTTDGEGWRGKRSLDESDIVVFGDSFAFGHGVDDEDMYTEHTQPFTSKGLGCDVYSMVHAVLWMRRLRERIAGKHVVWMIYLGNDLYDNLRPNYRHYRVPFVRSVSRSWEIQTDHVSPEPWPFPEANPNYIDELARLCTDGPESARALEAAGALLAEAAELCGQLGASLTVLTVPRRDQIDPERLPDLQRRSSDPSRFSVELLDQGLRDTCEQLGLRCVSLAAHLEADDYRDHDIHWTPGGNAKVGRLIAELHGERLTASR